MPGSLSNAQPEISPITVIKRCGLILAAMVCAVPGRADNGELWDFYPAKLTFELSGSATVPERWYTPWFGFDDSGQRLAGPEWLIDLEDGHSKVSIQLDNGVELDWLASAVWAWRVVHEQSFALLNCAVAYVQQVGVRRLEQSEGYAIGWRESLHWTPQTGAQPPIACTDILESYLNRPMSDSLIPLHVGDWQRLGAGASPMPSGQFSTTLRYDLRKSRRLLPIDQGVTVGADPIARSLPTPGRAQDRAALIKSRLQPLLFRDRFEDF